MTDDEFEQTVKEMHASISRLEGWIAEIMPAARVAVKMLNARESVMRRWRGNGKHAA